MGTKQNRSNVHLLANLPPQEKSRRKTLLLREVTRPSSLSTFPATKVQARGSHKPRNRQRKKCLYIGVSLINRAEETPSRLRDPHHFP